MALFCRMTWRKLVTSMSSLSPAALKIELRRDRAAATEWWPGRVGGYGKQSPASFSSVLLVLTVREFKLTGLAISCLLIVLLLLWGSTPSGCSDVTRSTNEQKLSTRGRGCGDCCRGEGKSIIDSYELCLPSLAGVPDANDTGVWLPVADIAVTDTSEKLKLRNDEGRRLDVSTSILSELSLGSVSASVDACSTVGMKSSLKKCSGMLTADPSCCFCCWYWCCTERSKISAVAAFAAGVKYGNSWL